VGQAVTRRPEECAGACSLRTRPLPKVHPPCSSELGAQSGLKLDRTGRHPLRIVEVDPQPTSASDDLPLPVCRLDVFACAFHGDVLDNVTGQETTPICSNLLMHKQKLVSASRLLGRDYLEALAVQRSWRILWY
jgi:hypothetical protein